MTHARVFARFRETHMRLFGAIEKRVLGVRFRDWGKQTTTLNLQTSRNESGLADADIERSPDPDPVSEVEVEEPWQAEGEESELDGDDDAERSMEVFLTDREVTDMAYARNWVWARTGHNAWDSDIADTMMRKHPSRNFSISDWHTAYLRNIRRIDYAAKHRVHERMTVKDESME
ncbi:hypothetical protein EXIGLDRAFT_737502 [Exidia glandulosa HHB12029]|uniref:Uncharacterized protein n=1 Tax=Exidia glandulosa HHB12029 TaxID=1314781 RepID=A0A165IYA0_EXIGL|nr:hypothetical protein EXIGLDRAFT_737502 [Exidia glandulosa HHB12029]